MSSKLSRYHDRLKTYLAKAEALPVGMFRTLWLKLARDYQTLIADEERKVERIAEVSPVSGTATPEPTRVPPARRAS